MAHIKCFVHTLSVAFILRKKSEWLLSYSWYRINIYSHNNQKTGAIESERERLRYDSCTGSVSCTKKTMKDIMFILHVYIYILFMGLATPYVLTLPMQKMLTRLWQVAAINTVTVLIASNKSYCYFSCYSAVSE